jgi:S-formylglutathione hydrolase
MTSVELLAENRCFDGVHRRYRHQSQVLQCAMTFSVYLPPQALKGAKVPALHWLSGLTCTDENFMQKAGAQRHAAAFGLALVAPDTSPRGGHVPGNPDGGWEFGHGAGFYVDATEEPWRQNYQMHSYVVQELPDLLESFLPIDPEHRGISGHSMGGYGALVAFLRHPKRYRSVSAFAPIANPSACPWGIHAFRHLLGTDTDHWKAWDPTSLMEQLMGPLAENLIAQSASSDSSFQPYPILVDQGTADTYLNEQLNPAALSAAATATGLPLELRMREGYDHGYYFVASFMEDHLAHHARALKEMP